MAYLRADPTMPCEPLPCLVPCYWKKRGYATGLHWEWDRDGSLCREWTNRWKEGAFRGFFLSGVDLSRDKWQSRSLWWDNVRLQYYKGMEKISHGLISLKCFCLYPSNAPYYQIILHPEDICISVMRSLFFLYWPCYNFVINWINCQTCVLIN